MRALAVSAVLALSACTPPVKVIHVQPKTAVIVGNQTTPAQCEWPPSEHDRAERWKAYAEKLEAQLGLHPQDKDKP
jgi:hypothetical protein